MRAQIAITRNGITQASSDKSPPEGGVLARRTVTSTSSMRCIVNEEKFLHALMAFTSEDQARAVRLSQAVRLSKAFRPEVQHTCAGRIATT